MVIRGVQWPEWLIEKACRGRVVGKGALADGGIRRGDGSELADS